MVCGKRPIVIEEGRGLVRPAPDHTHSGLENAMPKSTAKCSRCQESKPLAEFYKDATRPLGVQSYCKPCDNAYRRQWDKKNPVRRSARRRRWEEENPGITRVYSQRYSRRHPGRMVASALGWQKRNPEKLTAQRLLRNAIRRGEIHRPAHCERCGRSARVHGHHADYSKWSEVDWLCAKCHVNFHLDLERGAI